MFIQIGEIDSSSSRSSRSSWSMVHDHIVSYRKVMMMLMVMVMIKV